ncbi:4Fe-4S dicluster domain-containing protein [Puteibacter caeruleilacunae]|nr:4Fe-4S dicluster domain-containing protein [Puteibacter caeruleilacunae]
METTKVRLIYFSPTHTTQKIVKAIGEGLIPDKLQDCNLTLPDECTQEMNIEADELAVIGVPVYGGRVPNDAVERLNALEGNGAKAIVVVVYGNRHYEDALLELRDIAKNNGFMPIAGGVFVGEHSYATTEYPIALSRPDVEDLNVAKAFGASIKNEILTGANTIREVNVPGNYPYKERSPKRDIVPSTKSDLCNNCGICAEVCPSGAVTITEEVVTDAEKCIMCCACVKECPSEARIMDHEVVQGFRKMLTEKCSERKDPEFYL